MTPHKLTFQSGIDRMKHHGKRAMTDLQIIKEAFDSVRPSSMQTIMLSDYGQQLLNRLEKAEEEVEYWKGYVYFVDDCLDAEELYEESIMEKNIENT